MSILNDVVSDNRSRLTDQHAITCWSVRRFLLSETTSFSIDINLSNEIQHPAATKYFNAALDKAGSTVELFF